MISSLFWALFLGLVASSASADTDSTIPGRIYAEAEAARIFAPFGADIFGFSPPFWTPSTGEIEVLEAGLSSFLRSNQPEDRSAIGELSGYKRQYFGVTRDGRRAIFVSAFCRNHWEAHPNWEEHLVFPLDGGSCYFQLFYNPDARSFYGLSINGEA